MSSENQYQKADTLRAIALRAGVPTQHLYDLKRDKEDFPTPVGHLNGVALYDEREVLIFAGLPVVRLL